jgi:hypothetical protein
MSRQDELQEFIKELAPFDNGVWTPEYLAEFELTDERLAPVYADRLNCSTQGALEHLADLLNIERERREEGEYGESTSTYYERECFDRRI